MLGGVFVEGAVSRLEFQTAEARRGSMAPYRLSCAFYPPFEARLALLPRWNVCGELGPHVCVMRPRPAAGRRKPAIVPFVPNSQRRGKGMLSKFAEVCVCRGGLQLDTGAASCLQHRPPGLVLRSPCSEPDARDARDAKLCGCTTESPRIRESAVAADRGRVGTLHRRWHRICMLHICPRCRVE